MAASAGFTLIEALVVLAIIALVAGIGFPAWRDAALRRQRAEARAAITLAIAQARADAIAGDTLTRLALRGDGTALEFSSSRAAVPLAEGVRLAWPADGLAFGGDGTGSGGEGALVIGTESLPFTIDPLGGRVRFAR